MDEDYFKFQNLRDQWALKAPLPSEESMRYERERDRQANPHNDNYHNKKPRREDAQIISDRSYRFADMALTQQYGRTYTSWLLSQGYEMDQWKDSHRLRP